MSAARKAGLTRRSGQDHVQNASARKATALFPRSAIPLRVRRGQSATRRTDLGRTSTRDSGRTAIALYAEQVSAKLDQPAPGTDFAMLVRPRRAAQALHPQARMAALAHDRRARCPRLRSERLLRDQFPVPAAAGALAGAALACGRLSSRLPGTTASRTSSQQLETHIPPRTRTCT